MIAWILLRYHFLLLVVMQYNKLENPNNVYAPIRRKYDWIKKKMEIGLIYSWCDLAVIKYAYFIKIRIIVFNVYILRCLYFPSLFIETKLTRGPSNSTPRSLEAETKIEPIGRQNAPGSVLSDQSDFTTSVDRRRDSRHRWRSDVAWPDDNEKFCFVSLRMIDPQISARILMNAPWYASSACQRVFCELSAFDSLLWKCLKGGNRTLESNPSALLPRAHSCARRDGQKPWATGGWRNWSPWSINSKMLSVPLARVVTWICRR